MKNVVALILAGGTGSRLWPLSRPTNPKQLLSLTGRLSLLQETCRRIWAIIPPENQWIITGENYYIQVMNQVKSLISEYQHESDQKTASVQILKEPAGKNTAPAVFYAAKLCAELYGEECVLVVLPSDHVISREDIFLDILIKAMKKAQEGYLVLFGIKPTKPETGYGYIKTTEPPLSCGEFHPVNAFTEKPDLAEAEKYLSSGLYLWNSGMYVFHVGTLLEEGRKHCPQVANAFLECNIADEDSVSQIYKKIPTESIDTALMEKTTKSLVTPISVTDWTDMGSWQSFYEYSTKDKDRNVLKGEVVVINSSEALIYGGERLIAVVGINKIAVIDTPDALLVCHLDQTQLTKDVAQIIKGKNSRIQAGHQAVEKPWGYYTIIHEGPYYKIKKIVIRPKQILSLQKHYHRSEHWVVVRGTAKITIDDTDSIISENHSAYIPKAALHRAENPGFVDLEIIETQYGIYLEEDDIVRLDDMYGR